MKKITEMITTLRMRVSSQVDRVQGQGGDEAASKGRRGGQGACVFIDIATVLSWRNLYPCLFMLDV